MEKIHSDLVDFTYINGEETSPNILQALYSSPSYIALDTESYPLFDKYGDKSSGLDPYTSKVRLISLHIHGETYVIDCLYHKPIDILNALSKHTVIAHNAVHDIKAIKRSFGVDLTLRCTHTALCTLAVSTGWKSALMRGKGLDDMARDVFSIHLKKGYGTSDWSKKKLSREQLIYSALDVAAPKNSGVKSVLIEAYQLIEKTCCEDLNEKFAFYLDQDMLPILADMALNGLPMNKDLLELTSSSFSPLIDDLVLKLCSFLSLPIEKRMAFKNGSFTKQIHIPEQTSRLLNNNKDLVKHVRGKLRSNGGEDISDLQADTLLSYIKSLESESDNEEEENDISISEVSTDIDMLKILLSYKKLSKMKSEVDKYISNLNPVTGYLHTNTNVIGTATARMSSSGGEGQARVNIQQISTLPFDIEYEKDNQLFDMS